MLTVGVEEEFLLVDPAGTVVPVAAEVVKAADDPRVKPELMTYQVETASDVCTDLAELGSQLLELRHRIADAASRAGAGLVAAGAPLVDGPDASFVTRSERYRGLAEMFPEATARGGTCACQVHVGVPDPRLAVLVLARLRRWLPTLFALGTNSPLEGGRDTGWASTRYARCLLWPTFRPPRSWASGEAYEAELHSLLGRGAAYDLRSVYFMARLSPRYPTIEIRVADSCLTVADAVLLAGVCRALVGALLQDVRHGVPDLPVPEEALRSALLGVAVDGRPPSVEPPEVARTLTLTRLLRRILPGTTDARDADAIACGLERVSRTGTGADRQRALRASASGMEPFVAGLREATVSEGEAA